MFGLRKHAARLRKLEIELAAAEGVSAALVGLVKAILLHMPNELHDEIIEDMKALVGEGFGIKFADDLDNERVGAYNNRMSRVIQNFIKAHEKRKTTP